MILTQEISQNRFHTISELTPRMQRLMKKLPCENCEENLKEPARIHYVLLSNGKIIWWHELCKHIKANDSQRIPQEMEISK